MASCGLLLGVEVNKGITTKHTTQVLHSYSRKMC